MIRYWEEDTETEIGRPFDLEKHDKEISDKWLEKVKRAKAEIKSISQEVPYKNQAFSYGVNICETSKVLKILDKLIAESEET